MRLPAFIISLGCFVILLAWPFGQTLAWGQPTPPTTAAAALVNPPSSQPDQKASSAQASLDFDLEAYLDELAPPTVEETAQRLEPIPTREEVLEGLRHPERLPSRPVLPEEVAKEVEEWQQSIQQESRRFLEGKRNTLDDIIETAENVLQKRLQYQAQWDGSRKHGDGEEWYEVADARLRIVDLRALNSLDSAARDQLVKAAQLSADGIHDYQRSDLVAAESRFRQAFGIRVRILGSQHSGTATHLNNIAAVLQARCQFPRAERMYRAAIALRLQHNAGMHPDLAENVNNLAAVLQSEGDYSAAELLYRKALAIEMRCKDLRHPSVVNSINNLATILRDRGECLNAELLLREAMASSPRSLDRSQNVATCLNNLASLLKARGDYAGAEPLYREAIVVFRQVHGNMPHPDVATALNNLAGLLQTRGDYATAEPLLHETISMLRGIYQDAPNPHLTNAKYNLATLFQAMGRHREAEAVYRECLAEQRVIHPSEMHVDVAESLNGLAALLRTKNTKASRAEARVRYRMTMAILREIHGDIHPDIALAMIGLARLLQDEGNYTEAEELCRKAQAMLRSIHAHPHLHELIACLYLAKSLYGKGEYASAGSVLSETAPTFELIRLSTAMGGLDRMTSDVGYSPFPLQAAVLARLGQDSSAWKAVESHMARGLLDEVTMRAIRPLDPGEALYEEKLTNKITSVEESIAALAGWKPTTASQIENAEHMVTRLQTEHEEDLAELTTFRKGLEGKHGVAAGEVYELNQIQAQLAQDVAMVMWLDIQGNPKAADPNGDHWACVVRGKGPPIWTKLPGSGPGGTWSDEDDSLPRRLREAFSDSAAASIQDLPSLLEALRRQRIEPIEQQLHAGDGLPEVRQLIILPAASMVGVPVEALTGRYTVSYAPSGTMYAWLKERAKATTAQSGTTAARAILAVGAPVFRRPGGANETTTAPALNHGAIIAAVARGGNGERSGLNVGDIILRYDDQELPGPNDLAIAIQHAQDAEVEPLSMSGSHTSTQRATKPISIEVWRAGRAISLTVPSGDLAVRLGNQAVGELTEANRRLDAMLTGARGPDSQFLSGAHHEIECVRRLFNQGGDSGAVTFLIGTDASEETLAHMAQSGVLTRFRYLHFATHAVLDDRRAMRSALILSQDNLPDPYDRVVAGMEVYDGRLTADRIARTWKLNADLVTLSACKTALGRQVGGEGMIGFAQALFVAGARSLILSLWEVDDTATELLLTRFYENLLGQYISPREGLFSGAPMSKAEALREAKDWVRRASAEELADVLKRYESLSEEKVERRTAQQPATGLAESRGELDTRPGAAPRRPDSPHDYSHPYYWAGFVLIGDPD